LVLVKNSCNIILFNIYFFVMFIIFIYLTFWILPDVIFIVDLWLVLETKASCWCKNLIRICSLFTVSSVLIIGIYIIFRIIKVILISKRVVYFGVLSWMLLWIFRFRWALLRIYLEVLIWLTIFSMKLGWTFLVFVLLRYDVRIFSRRMNLKRPGWVYLILIFRRPIIQILKWKTKVWMVWILVL